MESVRKYFDINGKTISRTALKDVAKEAKKDEHLGIQQRILAILKNYPDTSNFKVKLGNPLNAGLNGWGLMNGLEELPGNFSDPTIDQKQGLNKAVSPDDIYQYITDTVLQLIEAGGEMPWRKGWNIEQSGGLATNFVSKKGYRGINYVMLNIIYPAYPSYNYDSPYFLTFKQIEKLGGKLQKGAHGFRVVYYTNLFKWQDAENNLDYGTYSEAKFRRWVKKNLSAINKGKAWKMDVESVVANAQIPILKYYNVFNGDDITGIDFGKAPEVTEKVFSAIESAEAIVESWDQKPPISHKGAQAFYTPGRDSVTMPAKRSFKSEPEYYGTLFHELIHSTGHEKRIGRDFSGKFGSPEYAFEELIAELGAAFLNGEAGILYHTMHNSAAYLKGWRNRLAEKMKEDNRFFFRASSAAQAAADFILSRDKEGIPKYLRDDAKKDKAIKDVLASPKKPSKPKKKASKSSKQLELTLNKKKTAVGPNGLLEDVSKAVETVSHKVDQGQKIVKQVKSIPGVLSIGEMLSMKFDKMNFTGPWEEFMQNVPPNLRLLVYGQGKNGKTSLSFQLAEYLSKFGPVLYNLADQGISATTQDLIKSSAISIDKNISFSEGRKIEELREAIKALDPQFVFIDLMNNYDIDARSFEAFMKEEFPSKGFILVMEATKGEDFRGEGTWLNIVDAKIFCKDFVAHNTGRLGFGEFIIWPERVEANKKALEKPSEG